MDIFSFVLGYNKGKMKSNENNGSDSSITEKDIFSLTTVTGFRFEEPYNWYYKILALSGIEIKDGETYFVNWDGVKYACQGISASLGDYNFVYLGNGSSFGYPGNNEQFGIIYFKDYGYLQAVSFNDPSDSHNIRIYQNAVVGIQPLTVTENGTYEAPEGVAYSPVTVSVPSSEGGFLTGYDLVEILAPTELSLTTGGAWIAPDNIGVMIATADDVKNGTVEAIETNESALVILNHRDLYAVCASNRRTSGVKVGDNITSISISGCIGNISAVSALAISEGGTKFEVIEETRSYGSSDEPFFIIGNNNYGFQYVTTNSDPCTITVQIYKIKRKSYTVDFYDEDTLINSEQVRYGESSKYSTKPTKEGYLFKGWNPEPIDVTGDMTCHATWEVNMRFDYLSWAKIAEIAEAGNASTMFSVGDTRDAVIDGKTVTVEIIGFDHDDLSDGSGKAGITLRVKNIENVLATHGFGSTLTNSWTSSDGYPIVTGLIDKFEPELYAVVKEVNKKCAKKWESYPSYETLALKTWSISAAELGWNISYVASDEGTKYEIFTSKTSTSATDTNAALGRQYFTRSGHGNGGAWSVRTDGKIERVTKFNSSSYYYRDSVCFCI